MVANIKRGLIGTLALTASITAAAETLPITDEDALLYMEKLVREQFEITNQVIEACDKQRKNTAVEITPEQLKLAFRSLGLTSQEAILATTHIGIRNNDMCSSDARKELLFRANTLDKAKEAAGQPVKIEIEDTELTYTDLLSMALIPGIRQHKLTLRYETLPPEAKDYMETHFGTTPFEHMRFLSTLSDNS